ncbi:MAG: hypothetical protein ACLP8S_16955 [Solirubrobacteraceae bacterium]
MRAWRQLGPEQRLAAVAAFGLFLTLFLPWYQETVIATTTAKARNLVSASESLTGWGAFSFVEAAVLLVALSVLVLLFGRAEGRAFHLPGGDGSVITAAGAWTCILVIWRIFDKQGTSTTRVYATTSGIDWGIFVALGVAGLLTYAGTRIRASHRPEPPLPGEDGAVFDGQWHRAGVQRGGPAAGAGAAARSAHRAATRARSAPEPSTQVPASPGSEDSTVRGSEDPTVRGSEDPTVRVTQDPAVPNANVGERRERTVERSSWRPAERPEWSEPERPVGWLTAPPRSGAREGAQKPLRRRDPDPPPAPPVAPGEDHTRPLDGEG